MTTTNYITDWNAVNSMTFNGTSAAIRTIEPEVKPDTDIVICRLAKRGGKWAEIVVAKAPDLASARTYAANGRYLSHVTKDENGNITEKHYKTGKLFVRFHGTLPDKVERTPLRPMSKAETNAAINRNRARLGLAPLTFA